jgi:U6 snRNA-associated Sm-like protein LSm6
MKPSEFLVNIIGKQVVVKLNSGIEYRGKMKCLDGYMNISIEDTKEYYENSQTNEFKTCFIRGNNVLFISLE